MVTMQNPSGSPSLQELLLRVEFPKTKTELVEELRAEGAAEPVLTAIREAPTDRFTAPQEVVAAMRGQ